MATAAWDGARTSSDEKQKDELKTLATMTDRIDPMYAEGSAHGSAGSISGNVGSFHHSLLATRRGNL